MGTRGHLRGAGETPVAYGSLLFSCPPETTTLGWYPTPFFLFNSGWSVLGNHKWSIFGCHSQHHDAVLDGNQQPLLTETLYVNKSPPFPVFSMQKKWPINGICTTNGPLDVPVRRFFAEPNNPNDR
jgi:hypothetical protein